ncbi:MAG: sulfatase [Candidatus Wallbacteria bacterium]|nr:sulfatase [Candidatus Wallbacteria bacterium]
MLLALPSFAPAGTPPRRPNFVFFFIDTLRADHVGCYGYKRPTTPTIDNLAASGTLFENCFSQSTWSLPSYTTFFTSCYPRTHGVLSAARSLAPGMRTLPGIVGLRGYETVAFVGGGHLAPNFGLDRGFSLYNSSETASSISWSVRKAIRWLEARKPGPFLLFVHGYDVHSPYQSPLGFSEMYDPGYRGIVHRKGFLRLEFLSTITDGKFDPCDLDPEDAGNDSPDTLPAPWRPGPEGLWPRLPSLPHALTPADREHLIAHYDGALTYADSWLARLLDALRQKGDLENTVVAVSGDHGEHLLEHGFLGHSREPREQVIHVPLVMAGPGIARGRRIADPVGLIDVAPTVLDLCGAVPCRQHQGKSLAGYLSSTSSLASLQDPGAVSYHDDTYSFRTRDWHLLEWRQPDRLERVEVKLFHVARDPSELAEVGDQNPETRRQMLERLGDWSEEFDRPGTAAGSKLTPRLREILRRFGYW